MKLKELIKGIGFNRKALSDFRDFQVKGISCNSKKIKAGFVFVAIKGTKADGNKFITEAVKKGAKAVVFQSPFEFKKDLFPEVVFIPVIDTRLVLAKLCAEFYHRPSSKLKVVAVTGTNGKTTITYLIEAVLKEVNSHPAVIGTVNYRFKNKIFPSKNTTPGPEGLQLLLRKMLDAKSKYVVMEVSSHALDQDRVSGINFSSAIFTNLTQDHLDYHHNMEEYFKAKAKLFCSLGSKSFAVINIDDNYGRRLKKITHAKIVTYGLSNSADFYAKNIRMQIDGTKFIFAGPKKETEFNIRLTGKHNLYNVLSVLAWAENEGLDFNKVKKAIEKFTIIPGRLEKINSRKGFSVFVDYAHTPDALFNVLTALREVSRGRILTVFGCGGDRDKDKRPKMGNIACGLSDYVIVTNDNPRSENPSAIINSIKAGFKKGNYCIQADRFKAIKKALGLAKKNDVVLVAGKGHENYQIIKDKMLHFDDREAVRKCLKLMN